ncbi:MAG: hypothetical protein VXW72_06460 [Candidatus Thermoplasmatota archaeon]|nr:hypothetical protein [Candidatus Thermoplasmatota archaeon]
MLITSILLSALFAGIVATLVTIAIEMFGGRTGGVLATIPTTIVPAALGMYSISGETEFAQSMSIVPLGMMVNAIFLLVWIYAPQRFDLSLVGTTILSLIVWTLIGSLGLLISSELQASGVAALTYAISGLGLLILLGVWTTWTSRPAPKGSRSVRPSVLVLRGFAAATAIGIAVWFSSLSYPFVSGLVSTFPAIFLTSMIALWLAQGQDVPQGAAGPMMLGGASVGVYAVVAIVLFPMFGPVLGSIVTWLISIIAWTIPAYIYLQWRQSLTSLDQRSEAGTSTMSS